MTRGDEEGMARAAQPPGSKWARGLFAVAGIEDGATRETERTLEILSLGQLGQPSRFGTPGHPVSEVCRRRRNLACGTSRQG
jgi:hypothetical protein